MSTTDTTGPRAGDDLPDVAWHISTRSENVGGSCVEAGPLLDGSGRIAVRHSHHPQGVAIVYTAEEWRAFLEGAQAGEFNFTGETCIHP